MAPPTQTILEMQRRGLSDAEIITRLREKNFAEKDINDAFNQAKVKAAIKPFSPIADPPEFGPAPMQVPRATMPMAPVTEEFVPAPTPSDISEPYPVQGYAETAGAEGWEYPEGGEAGYESYGYAEPQAYAGYGAGYGEAYTVETFEEIAESIIEEKWREFTGKVGDIRIWKEVIDRDIARIEKRIDKIDEALNQIHAAMVEKVGEYGKSIKALGSDVKAVEEALKDIMEPLMRNVKELKGVTEEIKRKR